ncbi:MAG: FKBP-type peptidyl-prolyl cis-trans isomerase [Pyrinomonadaceae bacterium]
MKLTFCFLLLLIASMATLASGQSRARKAVKRPVAKPLPTVTGAIKTSSGLTYLVTKKTSGRLPKVGEIVQVNYTGTLTDGTKFDSSRDPGRTPIEFPLGQGRVIKGWDEGIGKLRVGEQAVFIIPSAIAYGPRGRGSIPPNATLIFIVELVGIKEIVPTSTPNTP